MLCRCLGRCSAAIHPIVAAILAPIPRLLLSLSAGAVHSQRVGKLLDGRCENLSRADSNVHDALMP